jgi:hypothetical protein
VYAVGSFVGPATIAGTTQHGAGGTDNLVAAFASSGARRWSVAMGGAGDDALSAAAVDLGDGPQAVHGGSEIFLLRLVAAGPP